MGERFCRVCVLVLLASAPAALAQTLTPDMVQRGNEAVARLNLHRQLSGLPAVTLDMTLSEGCALHANYLNLNKDQIFGGLDAHDEISGKPGFTAEGQTAGQNGDIHYGVTGTQAIDCWIQTYYHRNPMMSPGVTKVGYGDNPGSNVGFSIAVLEFFQFRGVADVVTPADGSDGNAAHGFPGGEVPAPVSGFGGDTGNPIIAYFSGASVAWVSSTVSANGQDLPHTVIAPNKPANSQFENNEICLITNAPLPSGTTISVSIQYTQSGSQSVQWSFKTSATGDFDAVAAQASLDAKGGGGGGGGAVGTPSVDTDGDGFLDEIETAAGTSASDPASTPFSGQPAGAPVALSLAKLGIKLNFAAAAGDSISFSGLLPFPPGISTAGQQVVVFAGGAAKAFSLDDKGKSLSSSEEQFKVATRSKDGFSKYSCKLSKGSFANALADEGLTNADATDAPKIVTVIVLFNQQLFQRDMVLLYSARAGKSGRTRVPRL